MDFIIRILPVISNFVFIGPISVTLFHKKYFYSIILLTTAIISYFYHFCRIEERSCFLSFYNIRLIDHVFSNALFVPIIFQYVHFLIFISSYIKLIIYIIILILNMSLALIFGFEHIVFTTTRIVFVLIPTIVVLYFIIHYKQHTMKDSFYFYCKIIFKRVHVPLYLFSIILGIIGLCCLVIDEPSELYDIIHSLWHIFICTTICILLFLEEKYNKLNEIEHSIIF